MILRLLAAAVLGVAAFCAPASAQRGGQPGDFDFYVLALSWSPTWCASAGDRADPVQCGRKRFGFVVHGLWPQYERGYPSECRAGGFPSRAVVDGMLDIMPSPGLIRHEWRTHGTCSGLGPEAYFKLTRKAREAVVIPEVYREADVRQTASPADIEREFIAVNPGLKPSMIAVQCNRDNLREVRVCLAKGSLAFRPCAEVDRRACRNSRIALPPAGGD